MENFLTWQALTAYFLMFDGVNNNQRHLRAISRGEIYASKFLDTSLIISVTIGHVFIVGLSIYCAIKVNWYIPIILWLAASFIGGFISSFLDYLFGAYERSIASFIIYPIGSIWFYNLCKTFSN